MISFFVKRPLFTLSIFTVILIIGLYGLGFLPLDFLPNIEIPTLTIVTPYPGASAEDIETQVSKVIEDAVATVPNVDKILSDSMENYSTVTISFKWGTRLDSASADVRDKMDQAKSKLPKDIQTPTIYKFDTSQIPVLTFGISSDQLYSSLYEIADKTISPNLKRIQGVGTVLISGGLQRQVNVDINRQKIEAYHLSINQINLALQAANLSMPAGSIKSGTLNFGIRIPGEFEKVKEIGKTIVGSFNGREIYLSDIAEVNDTFKEQESMTEVDGKPGVMIQIQKQSGANTVRVVKDIRRELLKMAPELPPDLKITFVMDTSESIVRQISELTQTLMYSFLFVVLTVLFFLRNFRGSIVISTAIPFSILAAFIFMFLSGTSINIISLASIIISIGVVVDDAIVVLENIYRHVEELGEGLVEGAINGTREVAGAVIASTTTNLVIFIPLLLVQGFIGIFFNQLSTITIVVIGMSLITAMFLTPMMSSRILKIIKRTGKNSALDNFFDKSETIFGRIESGYSQLLDWAIINRKKVIASLSLFFFFSLILFAFTGTEFFPEQDQGLIQATVLLPPGTRWDQTARAMKTLGKDLEKKIPELEFMMVQAGSSGTSMLGGKYGPNVGRLYLKVVPLNQRKRDIKELERVTALAAYSIPGVKTIDFSAMGANQMAGGGKPVTVEIYGSDFAKIDQTIEKIYSPITKVQGAVDLAVSREKTNPEYALIIDREKAAALGLSVYEIASTARNCIYGSAATKYREGGNEYDVFTRFKELDRKNIDDIKNVYVTSRTGANITLGNIARVELKTAPQVIQRKNQQRFVKIEGDSFGRPLGDVLGDVQKIIKKTSLPSGITVKITGSAEQIRESFRSLTISLIFGLALIYLVMVAQFESLLDPFINMFSVPFALAGVVWALFLTGEPFGIMAFIGLILVTGVSVKNTIVLIDFINILRRRGVELEAAILEAGKTRLRPIMMTSTTTILGLMPIILSTGEGSGFWKPMAVSVVGGLLVSFFISLIFVPVLYYVIEARLEKRRSRA